MILLRQVNDYLISWRLMGGFVTIKDVAALAGVSSCTVSYVLSGKKGRCISPATREKVEKAVDELNYVKSNGASSLRSARTGLVAILVPQFENPFFTRIISGAEKVLVSAGYDLLICNTCDKVSREKEVMKRMVQQRVDGIILAPTVGGAANIDFLESIGMKYVVVDRDAGRNSCSSVLSDNYGSGKIAAEYLFSCGHRKVGYIGWSSGRKDLAERAEAIKAVFGDSLIIAEGDFSRDSGNKLTEEILSSHSDITALIYGFNIQAYGGIEYLYEKNIRIPDDLSVIIIGTPEWAAVGMDFTRVNQGDHALGHTAADYLIARINTPDDSFTPMHSVQSCTLIEGSTVKHMEEGI